MNNNQIVLKIIRNNKKALSAYDIVDKFQRIKRIQPMTVYRSLNSLISEGYVHKSNYHNTFVLCKFSHVENDITILSVCTKCKDIEEVVMDRNKMGLLLNVLDLKKFNTNKLQQIEIPAICKACE
jgi:Fur family zinc uptake transcriptional regulator